MSDGSLANGYRFCITRMQYNALDVDKLVSHSAGYCVIVVFPSK